MLDFASLVLNDALKEHLAEDDIVPELAEVGMYDFASVVLNDALDEHLAEDEEVLDLDRVGDDWSDCEADTGDARAINGVLPLSQHGRRTCSPPALDDLDDSDFQIDELEGMIPWEAVLGKDVSVCLGKDRAKTPKFTRFLQSPDIPSAVQELRSAAAARRDLRKKTPRCSETEPVEKQSGATTDTRTAVDVVPTEDALAEATISEEMQRCAAEEQMRDAEVDQIIQEEMGILPGCRAKSDFGETCSTNADSEVDQLIHEELQRSSPAATSSTMCSTTSSSSASRATTATVPEVPDFPRDAMPAGSPAAAARKLRLRQQSCPSLLLEEDSPKASAEKNSSGVQRLGKRADVFGLNASGIGGAARGGAKLLDVHRSSAMAMDLGCRGDTSKPLQPLITKSPSSFLTFKPATMSRTKSQPAGVKALTKSNGGLANLGELRNRPVWTVVQH